MLAGEDMTLTRHSSAPLACKVSYRGGIGETVSSSKELVGLAAT